MITRVSNVSIFSPKLVQALNVLFNYEVATIMCLENKLLEEYVHFHYDLYRV